jgi:SAM-dependent methyltransferase
MLIYLGQPGYGQLTAGAARAFWRASRRPDSEIYRQYNEGSLLAANFNGLWCSALNLCRKGETVDYFAMIHADVEPADYWLDTMIGILESEQLDILGASVPIKDPRGLTSLALDRDDGDTWRPLCRLTQHEVHSLPETFTGADLGGRRLLLNTGMWVCRFDEAWARKVAFTINDRIVQDPQGLYHAQTEPEDWYFSRLCHELGLKVGATRAVPLVHRGSTEFASYQLWGEPHDSAYVEASVIEAAPLEPGFTFPGDVDGWLSPQEGHALARLAKGKRVLEIGSYLGLSTICMAATAKHVVSVDPHDGRGTPHPQDTLATFRANIERHGVADRVEWIAATFEEANRLHPPVFESFTPFDLIFIDGAHDAESVASDIRHALPLLKPGGLLAFHDYRRHCDPGVRESVDAYLAASGAALVSVTGTVAVVRPPARTLEPLEV